MTKTRDKILMVSAVVFSLNVLSSDNVYVTKKGDTLSQVLWEKRILPIYGKEGSLAKTLKLNPGLKISKGNKIFPNSKVILAESVQEEPILEPVAMTAKNNEMEEKQPEVASARTTANKDILSHSNFGIAGSSRFVRLRATDEASNAQSTLISDAGVGYEIFWGQSWSEEFTTRLSYEHYNVIISDSSSTTKVLLNRKQALSQYEFSGRYKLASSLGITSSVAYGESLVNRASSTNAITVEKFQSPKLSAGLDYILIARDELKLLSLADLTLALPSSRESYQSKASLGYKLGIGIVDKISTFRLHGELFYKNLDMKMEGASYVQTEIGMTIGVTKDFGEF